MNNIEKEKKWWQAVLPKQRRGEDDVSRAESKLKTVVKDFGIDFKDKVVLDIGSSTGGFTDLALKLGAAKVIAVEKGSHQMREDLRHDKRVQLHEKTNIFTVGKSELMAVQLKEVPDIVMADVSFISIRPVLEHVRNQIGNKRTKLLVLFKPQFEAHGAQLRNGIVKNSRVRREIIMEFEQWLKVAGFVVLGKRDSVVTGRYGNIERIYALKLADRDRATIREEASSRAGAN